MWYNYTNAIRIYTKDVKNFMHKKTHNIQICPSLILKFTCPLHNLNKNKNNPVISQGSQQKLTDCKTEQMIGVNGFLA